MKLSERRNSNNIFIYTSIIFRLPYILFINFLTHFSDIFYFLFSDVAVIRCVRGRRDEEEETVSVMCVIVLDISFHQALSRCKKRP